MEFLILLGNFGESWGFSNCLWGGTEKKVFWFLKDNQQSKHDFQRARSHSAERTRADRSPVSARFHKLLE